MGLSETQTLSNLDFKIEIVSDETAGSDSKFHGFTALTEN